MAVAFDAAASAITFETSNTSPFTNANLTVGASATLLLGIFTATNQGTAAAAVPSAMTWNGATMTLIGSKVASDTFSDVYVYGIVNPATGNKTLSCTFTGGAGTVTTFLDAVSFTGTLTTSVAAACTNVISDASNSTAGDLYPTSALAVTTAAGDAAFAAMASEFNLIESANAGTFIHYSGGAGIGLLADIYALASGTTTNLQGNVPVGGPNPCCSVAFRIVQANATSLTATNLATGAAGFANSEPVFAGFTPIWLNTWVLDNGLLGLDANSDTVWICSQQPADFTGATVTYGLGSNSFGAGNVFPGSPTNGTPNGRVITSSAITAGNVTANGTPTYWAIVDTVNSRLLATGPLSGGIPIVATNQFALSAITIHIPSQ